MSRLGIAATGGALLLGGAAGWWWAGGSTDEALPAGSVPATVTAVEPAPRTAAAPVAPARPEPGAPPACAGAPLVIAGQAGRAQACLSPLVLSRSGDVGTWRSNSVPDGWELRVEVGGDDVLAVHLRGPDGRVASCEDQACAGATIGPRDAHGARRLALHQLELRMAAERWTLEGAFALAASADAASCPDEGVALSGADGSAWHFCPGTWAVARLENGERVFHLRSTEGQVLRVGIAPDGALGEIALGGRQCTRWQCSGAVLVADADGALALQLDGVALSDRAAAQASVLRLQGRLRLQPS